MKAVVVKAYGNHSVIEIQERELSPLENNQIRIKVMASQVSRADTMMLTGKPYFARLFLGLFKPKFKALGTGFSGIIEDIGDHVTTFKVGDEVCGESVHNFSANAEFLTLSDNEVIIKKPEKLSHAEASTLCDGVLTSYNFLMSLAEIKKDDEILINGASGSLGSMAIMLAKSVGAKVTALCSTQSKDFVEQLDVDSIITYDTQNYLETNQHFDMIYDTVGNLSYCESRKVMKKRSKFLSPVLNFGLLLQMIVTSKKRGKSAIFAATGLEKPKKLLSMLERISLLIEEGKIKPIIEKEYPLSDAKEAYKHVESGRKKGSVVLLT